MKNIKNSHFPSIAGLLKSLGPGLVTEASDDDPFKNIGEIDGDSFPVGFVDKIKVIYYSH